MHDFTYRPKAAATLQRLIRPLAVNSARGRIPESALARAASSCQAHGCSRSRVFHHQLHWLIRQGRESVEQGQSIDADRETASTAGGACAQRRPRTCRVRGACTVREFIETPAPARPPELTRIAIVKSSLVGIQHVDGTRSGDMKARCSSRSEMPTRCRLRTFRTVGAPPARR